MVNEERNRRHGELPPLLVKVVRAGKVVRTIKLADPRTGFMRAYNQIATKHGFTAVA